MSDITVDSGVDIISALHCSISILFESSRYSDFVIRCSDGTEYQVHKSLVCTQCQFFANVVDGGFIESNGTVTLNNDPPAAIRALLQHLYGIEYEESDDTAKVVFHVQVHTVGEIYQVPELKTLAAFRFRQAASDDDINNLDLAQAIKEIYESTPTSNRTLRDAARDLVLERLDELIGDDEFMRIMEEVRAFGLLISRTLWDKMEKMKKITPHFECPACFSHEVISGHEKFSSRKMIRCQVCLQQNTWKNWRSRVV